MALPVIGVAVALLRANTASKLFGGARKDATGALGNIRLTFKLSKGGRGIRKAERRMAASAKRAAMLAANATGRELYEALVPIMATEAGASEAAIKKTLIRKGIIYLTEFQAAFGSPFLLSAFWLGLPALVFRSKARPTISGVAPL